VEQGDDGGDGRIDDDSLSEGGGDDFYSVENCLNALHTSYPTAANHEK
jgi:hypothetical protein